MGRTKKLVSMASLRKEIEKHKVAIAKHRDALRELVADAESVMDSTSGAVTYLEAAIDDLSQYL